MLVLTWSRNDETLIQINAPNRWVSQPHMLLLKATLYSKEVGCKVWYGQLTPNWKEAAFRWPTLLTLGSNSIHSPSWCPTPTTNNTPSNPNHNIRINISHTPTQIKYSQRGNLLLCFPTYLRKQEAEETDKKCLQILYTS